MVSSAFLIPNGPKNLQSLFPLIDFNAMSEYYLELLDENGDIVATTPVNKSGCCCSTDKVRIHFLNYMGKFDCKNFPKPEILHEDFSSSYEKGLSYPLQKTDTGSERFDIKSNDTYEARLYCNETEMPWLQELADSPKILMEWTGIEGQPDAYIPVVKLDGKFKKLKNVEEFRYEFVMQFKLANEYFIIRN